MFRFFQQKAKVGILDADVYGPSIPRMMNLEGPIYMNEGKTTQL